MVALVKGDERYVFMYSDENSGDVVRRMGRYASDRELSFSWYDAAVLSQKIRRQSQCENLGYNGVSADVSGYPVHRED